MYTEIQLDYMLSLFVQERVDAEEMISAVHQLKEDFGLETLEQVREVVIRYLTDSKAKKVE